jgi:hypothetical protein
LSYIAASHTISSAVSISCDERIESHEGLALKRVRIA